MRIPKAAFVGFSSLIGGVLLTATSCTNVTVTPAPVATSPSASFPSDSMMSASPGENSMTGGSLGTMVHADIMFLEMMIPHHEQAVEMSKLASTNGATASVQQLADAISAAQGPEIAQMQAWLKEAQAPDMMGDGHMSMSGILSESQMKQLAASSGTAFDRLYLEGMIGHHQGAIKMAQDEIDAGGNPTVIALAEKIIASQTAEITKMQSMLTS